MNGNYAENGASVYFQIYTHPHTNTRTQIINFNKAELLIDDDPSEGHFFRVIKMITRNSRRWTFVLPDKI